MQYSSSGSGKDSISIHPLTFLSIFGLRTRSPFFSSSDSLSSTKTTALIRSISSLLLISVLLR